MASIVDKAAETGGQPQCHSILFPGTIWIGYGAKQARCPEAAVNPAQGPRRRVQRRGSVMEDLAQEQLGTIVTGIVEKLVRLVLFHYLPAVHEHHPVGNGLGEPHFVGHA